MRATEDLNLVQMPNKWREIIEDMEHKLKNDPSYRSKTLCLKDGKMTVGPKPKFETPPKQIRGYSQHKDTHKFNARITLNGKLRGLGSFDTEAEARKAYVTAYNKHYPEHIEE